MAGRARAGARRQARRPHSAIASCSRAGTSRSQFGIVATDVRTTGVHRGRHTARPGHRRHRSRPRPGRRVGARCPEVQTAADEAVRQPRSHRRFRLPGFAARRACAPDGAAAPSRPARRMAGQAAHTGRAARRGGAVGRRRPVHVLHQQRRRRPRCRDVDLGRRGHRPQRRWRPGDPPRGRRVVDRPARHTPGIVVDVLQVHDGNLAPAPGISIDGVGVRLGRTSGPLIDAGLRLDSVAVAPVRQRPAGLRTMRPAYAGGVRVRARRTRRPARSGGGGDNAVAQGIMRDAGGSGAPPRPAFSPAIAVQDHGDGVAVTLAGRKRRRTVVHADPTSLRSGLPRADRTWGSSYQQGVTPRQLEMISLYLDGQVSLLGLTAAVDKLRSRLPRDAAVLRGLVLGGRRRGLRDREQTSAGSRWPAGCGGSRSTPPLNGVEYLGMLKVGYASYGVDLFGGYAHPTNAGRLAVRVVLRVRRAARADRRTAGLLHHRNRRRLRHQPRPR